jgi:hypothetical protein
MLRHFRLRELVAILIGVRSRGWPDALAITLLCACAFPPAHAMAALFPSSDGTAVYDSINNISWLGDANLAASNRFGLPVCDNTTNLKMCVNPSGSMTYEAASAWVAAMNAGNYLGHADWQLPTTPSTDATCPFIGPNGSSFGFGCLASALGSLYYGALGLHAPNSAVPAANGSTGPFSNFQPYLYWSQTSANGIGYRTFSFNSGFHGSNTMPNYLYVLPMIPGKIPGTPTTTGTGLQVNPGGQTVYDPVMNVTWLANANLAAANTLGLPPCKTQGNPKICVNEDGAMNWNSAAQFVAEMNTINGTGYLGQSNWELPPMDPNCDTAYGCVSSSDPFGELYFGQLGFRAGVPVVATPDVAVGPFHNIQPYLYWSCQGNTIQGACGTDGPAIGFEWTFSFGNGFLGTDVLKNNFYAIAYYPGPPTVGTVPVIEYYNQGLDHYFMTASPSDISALDGGLFFGWARTGESFKAFPAEAFASLGPVCRFFIPPQHGSSHFFSANPADCSFLLMAAADPVNFPSFSGYTEENAAAFYVTSPDATGTCPTGTVPVFRLWNQRFDSNHRYTTSQAIVAQMLAKNYVLEGATPDHAAMCAAM